MQGCHVLLEWLFHSLQNGGFFLLYVSHSYVAGWQLTKQLKMTKLASTHLQQTQLGGKTT